MTVVLMGVPKRICLSLAIGWMAALGLPPTVLAQETVISPEEELDSPFLPPPATAVASANGSSASPTAAPRPPVRTGVPSAKPTSMPSMTTEEAKEHAEALRRRDEWIKRYCGRAQDDPQCQFYLKKRLFEAMRRMQRREKSALPPDEYCESNKDDKDCVARKQKEEREYLRKKIREIKLYCQENPDSERCDLFFMKGELSTVDPKEKKAAEVDEQALEQIDRLSHFPTIDSAPPVEEYGESTLFESDGGF